MANEKTAADYRKERKERLAKAAKKNSKKAKKISASPVSRKSKNVAAIVVAAVVIVGVVVLLMNYFGVFRRMSSVATVGNTKVSAVEYEYYYNYLHNQYYSQASNYESQYGTGYGYAYTGFDTTKLPEDQQNANAGYKLDDGSNPTWKQFFEHQALQNIRQYIILSNEAEKAGFTLTDDDMKEIDKNIEDLRQSIIDSASSNNTAVISLSKYLQTYFGKGMSEGTFKKFVERETLVANYVQDLNEKTMEGYTEDELVAEYDKDPSAFDCVDFRAFYISPEQVTYKDGATEAEQKAADDAEAKRVKDKADEFFGKVTDSASFKTLAAEYATAAQKENSDYSLDQTTLSKYIEKDSLSSLGEEATNWLYSKDRKVGEKKLFEFDGSYGIFMIEKPAYRDDATLPVDVRHVLYQFDAEAEDTAVDKETQKVAAQDAYDTWVKNGATEDAFITLAADSDDTNSASNGGLIENVGKGQMVKPFEDWCFDPARKAGDHAVVETEYGYHLMYFVKQHAETYWKETIRTNLANTKIEDNLKTLEESDTYKITEKSSMPKAQERIYTNLITLNYPNVEKATTVATTAAATTAAAAQ